jgi:hypothetical protein
METYKVTTEVLIGATDDIHNVFLFLCRQMSLIGIFHARKKKLNGKAAINTETLCREI